MTLFIDFLAHYAIHLTVTICSFIMLARDNAFSDSDKIAFRALLYFNLFYLVTGYVEQNLGTYFFPASLLSVHITLRIAAASFNNFLKTLILLLLILGIFKPKKKHALLLAIPAALNALLALSNVSTKWLFSITPDNVYHVGPLNTLYLVLTYSYFGALIVLLIVLWDTKCPNERIAICEIVAMNTVASLLKLIGLAGDDLLQLSVNISILLYFLLLTVDRSNELIALQKQQIEQQKTSLMVSQIQPHFLYNTLSTICCLCHEDHLLAESTLIDFSQYLRNNLDIGQDPDPLIPIEKEIEHTRLYTNIERTRFCSLHVEYEVTDGGFLIPFLTIQPMVENAIRHGVRGLENGLVRITVERASDSHGHPCHTIIIADNGTGKSIAGNLGDHKGIGIANVRSRIEKLCGGSFTIDFTPEGTTVTITIPVNGSPS